MKIYSVQTYAGISFNSNKIIKNGQKLVPLSQFNGPVLKLTKKEINEIEKLRNAIADLELEKVRLDEYFHSIAARNTKSDYFNVSFESLDYQISVLQNKINAIKKNRYCIQLANMKK